MRRRSVLRVCLLAAAVSGLFACDPIDGGGGGGGGPISFTQGWAFIRRDDRNVYLADKSDLTRIGRLTTNGGNRHPSLSRDGKRVVFVHAEGTETSLMLVSTSGASAPTVLLAAADSRRNLRTPVFSPDGSKVAFAYDEGASSSLGLVNADGTGFEKLVGGPLAYASPSFGADGTSLLASAGNSSSSYTQLERVSLASRTTTTVLPTLGDATAVVNRVVASKDGTKVAFDGRIASGNARIFVANVSTRQVTQLTDYPGEPNANDSFPTWVGADKVGFSSDTGQADQVYALPATASKTSGGFELGSAIEPWYGP